MKIMLIAQLAHAINAAYCLSLGDTSQPSWADAPDWQKNSIIAGVEMHLANPDATPEQSHESWLEQKLDDGWVYGEVRDEEAKTHPCCRPYAELPAEQKAKDYLFRAVVHATKDIPDADEAVAAALKALPKSKKEALALVEAAKAEFAQAAPVQAQLIPAQPEIPLGHRVVEYTGRRRWIDNLYGSGLSFEQGQQRAVPGLLARSFLRHPDVFVEVDGASQAPAGDDTAQILDKAGQEQNEQRDQQTRLIELHHEILYMDRSALEQYAATNYQRQIDQAMTIEDARAFVSQLVDQYGAV